MAPITTTIRDIPSEVLLTEADGLPRASAVNLDHVQTVPKEKIGGLLATLSAERMNEVRGAGRTGSTPTPSAAAPDSTVNSRPSSV
ncbi:MAG TPA: type II toxin-antitoxin system PemK/MazF family toxin [Thermoanaerobaculia bacterium]|nr:type II toxin-antitoxin system PemK/MazF family toxin [Thermoanaerobaculia bacterium]